MNLSERLGDRLLSNPRSDRVRDVAALTRRSVRSKRGLFRAEGPQNVREALRLALSDTAALGLPGLDAVYVTEAELERHSEIAADLSEMSERGGVFIRAVSPEVLAAMTDAVTPQGMLAVCSTPGPELSAVLTRAELVCVLARVQDPGNAGTVVRTADAAGAHAAVFTSGSVDPFNPKAVRSSAGSLFHVPVVTGVQLSDVARLAQDHGLGILAADGYASVSVDHLADAALLRSAGVAAATDAENAAYDLSAPTAWLFGNEAQGLTADEKAHADLAVAVPLYGAAESLNVATAATVCLYSSARAQRRGRS